MADTALFEAYVNARKPDFLNTYTSTDIEAALIRGEDYISNRYEPYLVRGYTIEHERVQRAVYEATILELSSPGFFNKSYTTDSAKVLIEVEGMKWERTGMDRMEPLVIAIRDIMSPITSERNAMYHSIKAVGK